MLLQTLVELAAEDCGVIGCSRRQEQRRWLPVSLKQSEVSIASVAGQVTRATRMKLASFPAAITMAAAIATTTTESVSSKPAIQRTYKLALSPVSNNQMNGHPVLLKRLDWTAKTRIAKGARDSPETCELLSSAQIQRAKS